MAPIKLYGMSFSTCTRRVLMVLEEKGIPYELVTVDLTKGEHQAPEYIATKHPFGVIPVMEDGDLKIFESRAIARYIASAYANTGIDLLGKDAKERAVTEQWIEVEVHYFNKPCSTLVAQKFLNPFLYHKPVDEAVASAATADLAKVLDVYEARLATQPYLAGEKFTLADITHMPYFQYAIQHGGADALFETRPNVKAWWGRISGRPAWQKIIATSARL